MTFSVRVFDMARHREEGGDWLVEGFSTLEEARAYAEARMRASVEELRRPGMPAAELRSLWFLYGEDCVVVGEEGGGVALLDRYIAEPATPAECDWTRLAPRRRRFYAAVLISDAAGNSAWAGGFFTATARPTPGALLERFGEDAKAALARQGAAGAVPASIHVASLFDLPDPPSPAADGGPLRNWKLAVDFVCHDVKFGGSVEGVFTWPERPQGEVLSAMTHVLMAERLAVRGDGPDCAAHCEVLKVEVAETDAPADRPADRGAISTRPRQSP